ncbi:hypothetical protein Tco_1164259 [Tanacetum coccineum]
MRYRVSKKESWNGGKWLNASISGPAVQQLWTLYPGKQTANPVLRKSMTNTQTPPTVVNTTGAPVTNAVANHAEKPEKFNGQNFKCGTTERCSLSTHLRPCALWERNCTSVLNLCRRSIFLMHRLCKLWKHGNIRLLFSQESLERKYKTEDAGTKKFVVARFLDYKMVDSKSVTHQVQDLQVLLHNIHAEGMTLKDNKLAQKNTYTPDSAKANMVEHVGSSSRFNSKGNKKDKKKNDKRAKESRDLLPKAGM